MAARHASRRLVSSAAKRLSIIQPEAATREIRNGAGRHSRSLPVGDPFRAMMRKPGARRAVGKRTMMARAVLHGISTIAGLAGMQTIPDAPMWARMTLYAVSWIACAIGYLPILYLRERIVDEWDDRTRRIVRDEFDRCELQAYKRRVERERARHNAAAPDDEPAR